LCISYSSENNHCFTSSLSQFHLQTALCHPPAANTVFLISSQSHARTHPSILPQTKPNWPPDQPDLSIRNSRLEHQLGTWGKKARKCSPAWSHRLVNGRIVQFHSPKSSKSKHSSKDFLTANAARSRRRPSLSSSCESVSFVANTNREDEEGKMSSQPLLVAAPGMCLDLLYLYLHLPTYLSCGPDQ
jgi:hypothetical protein